MGLRLAIEGASRWRCAWHFEGCLSACCRDGVRRRSETPYDLLSLSGPGRTAFAEIVDLDGDGRGDVVTASFTRLPPDQRRMLRVHFQREDGTLSEKPDWTAPLPDGAAAYDFLRTPGGADEMLFMRRDRVTRLSLAGRVAVVARRRAARNDARGRCPTSAASTGCISRATGSRTSRCSSSRGSARSSSARSTARSRPALATQARANFFVPPRPGLLITDNEADLYFEHPRIDVGDVDGDGRGDLVVSNRHEVLVFLGRAAAGFAAKPDQRHVLRRLSETDLVRATGSARVEVRDWNGDGRADLLSSTTRGGLLSANTKTTLHVNRAGTWDVQKADQTFQFDGGWAATSFDDLDGDGKLEFVEVRLSLKTLELVEILLTRSIDPQLRVYRPAASQPFEAAPAFVRALDLAVSFETQRTIGFLPALQDLNNDGRLDLIAPSDGNQLEIHLGTPGAALDSQAIRQTFDTTGVIRFGDLDHNGLLDFVLHDPRRPSTPIRIGVNRGELPGTRVPPELRAREPAKPAP